MGGFSSEREISLKSGQAVYQCLKERLPEVAALDIRTDDYPSNCRFIREAAIDTAFIALHGRFGEDGQIQALLEAAGNHVKVDLVIFHQQQLDHGRLLGANGRNPVIASISGRVRQGKAESPSLSEPEALAKD